MRYIVLLALLLSTAANAADVRIAADGTPYGQIYRDFLTVAEEGCAAGKGAFPSASQAHRYHDVFEPRHPRIDPTCDNLRPFFKRRK
ncbi:hypothetical protein N2603_39440 [Bradyrhizobium huanghuaihaiense]|uniref:hypothetical protein n=1 Tax=Bradyrhizobium huanghuaihaiense TaxID=990078 RepID=UPI0021A9A9B4|nr:hypothetical protein [Bradyrhizobium sp. CB3035]UWU75947.1 hypothetical protein N2603_39440 [Bradyrhizobium sp. CB3035]